MTRYRWRLACDATKPAHRIYERFWTSKDQVGRIRQATYCWGGELDPDHCSFGYRRLVLQGEVEQPSAKAAADYAIHTAWWTLATMYGLRDSFGNPDDQAEPDNLDLRVREARAA